MDVNSYNDMIAREFSISPNPATLLQYAISETLPPISDYENAVRIIRENYPTCTDNIALIVGAHLFSEWCVGENVLLSILNRTIESLPHQEKAIAYFLNANHLRHTDEYYFRNPIYIQSLYKSVAVPVPFVNNYLWLSEIQPCKKSAKELITIARSNIKKIYSPQEISALTVEQMATSDFYINGHILGTHLSYAGYELLSERYSFD